MKKVNDLALSYLKGLKEAYVEAGGEKFGRTSNRLPRERLKATFRL